MFFLAEFNVIQPDWGLIFWTTFFFLIFWFIIGKYAFKPIGKALKDRESDIQGALDKAKEAKEEMANMKAENETLIAQAREERARIIKEAKDTGNNIVNEAKTKAKDEAQKIVLSAKTEINNQKQAAMIDVKNQAGTMAIDIAEKILKRELSNKAEQVSYVNDLVKDANLN